MIWTNAALGYNIKRNYVDNMDDTVSKAYAAWPTRLYLIGMDGFVNYAAGLGPFGFKPTAFGAAIEARLLREEPRAEARGSSKVSYRNPEYAILNYIIRR